MIDSKLIDEGRSLDRREGNLRWEWGDWALRVAPMGADHASNGALERLREAIVEAGIESVGFDTVWKYRSVAHAWPDRTRVLSASWSVHRELAGEDGRFELIEPGMTVDEACRRRGVRTTHQGTIDTAPVTPERVRQAIASDPGLAREIVRDPQVASRVNSALREQIEQDRRELPTPPRRPTSYSTGIVLQSVLILSMEAKSVLKDAEALAGMNDGAKQATRRVLADVREALDTIEAIMDGEDVQSTIDRILAEAG